MVSDSPETEVSYDDWQKPLLDSGSETENSDGDWKETRAPDSATHDLKVKETIVRDVVCNTGKKSFSFFKCSNRFFHKGFHSQKRVQTGGKRFGCDVCEKRFTEQGSLKTPMRVHTGEKPFGCDVCGNRFAKRGNLKKHMRVHTGEKPFGCDVYAKRFTEQGNLKEHKRGEKPFGCDVCGKRFTEQGNLKRHMRVHTGEKLFGCDVCGKRFTQQGNLKAHMTVHTGEKTFGCQSDRRMPGRPRSTDTQSQLVLRVCLLVDSAEASGSPYEEPLPATSA
ncbi:uncharacterized protein PEZ65_001846 [Lycodopsis pacificus]